MEFARVIDGCPITLGDTTEESEPSCLVIGDLVNVISFNVVCGRKQPIILVLVWF